jgi:hypothetical protein
MVETAAHLTDHVFPRLPVRLLDVNYPDRSATTILAGGSGE